MQFRILIHSFLLMFSNTGKALLLLHCGFTSSTILLLLPLLLSILIAVGSISVPSYSCIFHFRLCVAAFPFIFHTFSVSLRIARSTAVYISHLYYFVMFISLWEPRSGRPAHSAAPIAPGFDTSVKPLRNWVSRQQNPRHGTCGLKCGKSCFHLL